jgi:hypothetical protein
LEDIQSAWHVGDERTVSLSAMSAAYGLYDVHRAQDVKMVILDFEHDDLTTPINEKTKALITIQQKDCLMDAECAAGTRDGKDNTCGGPMYPGYYPTGNDMTTAARFAWLNNEYYNAIPNNFKQFIKMAKHKYNNSDYEDGTHIQASYIFYPSAREIVTLDGYAFDNEGYQYEYYKTASNRIKRPFWGESSALYFTRTALSGDDWVVINGDHAYRSGGHSHYSCAACGGNHAPAMCL